MKRDEDDDDDVFENNLEHFFMDYMRLCSSRAAQVVCMLTELFR